MILVRLALAGMSSLILISTFPSQTRIEVLNREIPAETFIEQPRISYIPYTEKNEKLLNCLAKYESTNNPEALNPNDNGSPSYGLLQFKRSTYNQFCVKKYGLPDDIMNPSYQRECADKMIEDGGIVHWTTRIYCT